MSGALTNRELCQLPTGDPDSAAYLQKFETENLFLGHLRIIYNKPAVASREDALSRARALNILR